MALAKRAERFPTRSLPTPLPDNDRPGLREVEGHVSRGLEPVRDVFVENFARRGELGGACCAYHHGAKVVDLWGGVRNKLTGEFWEQDTMVLVYSTWIAWPDRKSTRLNSSHSVTSRMPSSA